MDNEKECKETVGEIDYEILISLNYLRDLDIKNIDEEIRKLSDILQIRHIIIERHFYQLVKNDSIISNMESGHNRYSLTQTGTDTINEFERCNEEWIAIDKFIKTSIGNRKEQKIKIYKTIDKVLTIAAIVCILSIVYVVIFF
jgi:predicted transcriptional regulator